MTDPTSSPNAASAPPADLAPLLERFPDCFDWADPKPLKIGIIEDVLASQALGEGVGMKALRQMLAGYCSRPRYLKTLREGAARVDLQGRPAGAVSAADAESARERRAARKARMKALASRERPETPGAGRPQGAARAPDNTPIPKECRVTGRLELTVKFSDLPTPVTVHNGIKIGIDTGEGVVTAILPAKLWRKLEQAAGEHPAWVASVSGSLERFEGGEIALKNPAVQVFEKKAKPGADTAAPGTAAKVPAFPPSPSAPASEKVPAESGPPNPAVVGATLTLKGRDKKIV